MGYGSYEEFYDATYGQVVTARWHAGTPRAALLTTRQPAGDWSDQATPDLVVTQLLSGPVAATVDQGAGRITGRMRTGALLVAPPGHGSAIQVGGAHAVALLAVNYGALLRLAGEGAGLPPDGDFGPAHARVLDDPPLSSLFGWVWDRLDRGGTLAADEALLTLAGVLRGLAGGRPPPVGTLARWEMELVFDYLCDPAVGEVGAQELADAVGLPAWYLTRAFKARTGLSVSAWRRAWLGRGAGAGMRPLRAQ